jgi:hypothetical protein
MANYRVSMTANNNSNITTENKQKTTEENENKENINNFKLLTPKHELLNISLRLQIEFVVETHPAEEQ